MDHLTDFKPLQRVALPGVGDLPCSGLKLIVGPNSSGKTQFLHDLHQRIRGEPRVLVVAEVVELRKPDDLDTFLEVLEREGYVRKFTDDAGNDQLRPLTTFAGTGEAAPQINVTQPQLWFQSYSTADVGKVRRRIDFLGYFGRLLVTALFLDRRLTSVNQTGMFDFESQPPQNDLHALYVDDAARSSLLTEIQACFSRSVWPDASRGNILCLRASDDPNLPSAESRLSPKSMSQYRTIETEGDGLKSYVATCIALLLGRRPVCLLDEPEMCLHPPQAYNLGRFIGRYGASPERATFVATHSSHVLRGVIQTAPDLQIVRLTRRGPHFAAHLVPAEALSQILTRPTIRAETVLDGVFAQAVIVVEADSDRAVYQSVFETLNDEYRIDIHFAAVGGTGGIADTVRLYRTLRIPISVIADLDLLADPDRIRSILSELASEDFAKATALAASNLALAIKNMPPTLTADDARRRLNEFTSLPMDWANSDDVHLRGRINELAHELDRMSRLKRGGITAMPAEIASQAQALVQRLATVGLFVVPVGELEQWLSGRGISASARNKWAWANEAASTIRRVGPQDDDIWRFSRSIAQYLSQSL